MSIHAGSILHVGGNNVIDRIQSAGLGDVRIPQEVVRETGNPDVVGKVPGDPDFTFTLESLDVSTELEAWLTGKLGTNLASGTAAPGAGDADGTLYDFSSATRFVNIASPWKDPATGSAGVVAAGHLVPGYFPTRIRYRFGVTDNASQEVELSGGSYYYNGNAPVEQFETGDGTTTAFATDDPAVPYRVGGAEGTTFRSIFGVIVNGELQTEGVDFTQSNPGSSTPGSRTVTFTTAPASGADIRFAYFTTAARSYPKPVHASTVVKPAAVRGRNICVYLGSGGARQKLGGVQSAEVEYTIDAEVEREFCNEEIVGVTINGNDTTGSITVRAKNADTFLSVLSKITGIAAGEVIGYLNLNQIRLDIEIRNPKDPATVLKTLSVDDAVFQIPGTPARVNTPTDFELRFESESGALKVYKGARP